MTEEMGDANWNALAEAVRARRGQLGLRQGDLEQRGGPGLGTVQNVEQAARGKYATRTFAQLEMALDWRPCTVGDLLSGATTPRDVYVSYAQSNTAGLRDLAREVRARREQLRLAQAELVHRGGPGEATVRRIERGELSAVQAKTKTRLELALRWPSGAVDRILNGTATRDELVAEVADGDPSPYENESCACRSSTPAVVIGRQVERVREKGRGWTAQQLADAMTEVGFNWDRFVVRNLELGKRKAVGVDELLMLAYVLGVNPIDLVVPGDLPNEEAFPLAADEPATTAGQVRDWFGGLGFLREPETRAELREAIRWMPENRADWMEDHWIPPSARSA